MFSTPKTPLYSDAENKVEAKEVAKVTTYGISFLSYLSRQNSILVGCEGGNQLMDCGTLEMKPTQIASRTQSAIELPTGTVISKNNIGTFIRPLGGGEIRIQEIKSDLREITTLPLQTNLCFYPNDHIYALDLKTHQTKKVIDGNFSSLCSLNDKLVTGGTYDDSPHEVKVWSWEKTANKFESTQDLTKEIKETHESKKILVRALDKDTLVIMDDHYKNPCTISLWQFDERGQLGKKHSVDFSTRKIWGFSPLQDGQQFMIWDMYQVFILDKQLRSAELTGIGRNDLQVLPSGTCFFTSGNSIQRANLHFGPIESILPSKLRECELPFNPSLLRLIADYACNYKALPEPGVTLTPQSHFPSVAPATLSLWETRPHGEEDSFTKMLLHRPFRKK